MIFNRKMLSRFKNIMLIVTLVFTFASTNSFADTGSSTQKLDDKLKVFEDYLGTWQSVFEMKEGKPSVTDVSKWERALNGKAVRTLHSINDGDYGGESLIFYDNAKQKIVFYYFTTAEFFTQGTIEIVNESTFIAYEDVTGNENGITKVKSTSKLLKDTMEVSTSYLKKGKWTKPESRTYLHSSAQVVFK